MRRVDEPGDAEGISQPEQESAEIKQTYTFREQLEGFPFFQVFLVMVARVAEPIAFTSLFPYIFFMVEHLRPEDSEAEVARYSGYIAGSFALCQALTGVFWGKMSDKYGRKPILVIGLLGLACSMLFFGLAGSFWAALLARSAGGLLNGNIGVLRTVLGEVTTERKHQALAFSSMSFLWQAGVVLGPMLGGWLAMPVESHPGWFDKGSSLERTFTKHPFLLPNLVVSVLLFLSCLCVLLFLEETHESFTKERNRLDPGLKIGDKILAMVSRGKLIRTREKETVEEVTEETGLLAGGSTTSSYDDESANNSLAPKALTSQVVMSIFAFSLFAMEATTIDELLPVILSTSVHSHQRFPFRFSGGLGMTSTEIGSLISITGFVGLSFMLFFFPTIDGRFGSLAPWKVVSVCIPVVCLIAPYLLVLNEFGSHLIVYFGAMGIFVVKSMLISTGYPAMTLIIQRSVKDNRTLGTVNGASEMLADAGRALGPIIWGFLMAKGQENNLVLLPWWILALAAVFGALVSFNLTEG